MGGVVKKGGSYIKGREIITDERRFVLRLKNGI